MTDLQIVEGTVYTQPDPAVLNDDNFDRGPQGWVPLVTGFDPCGPIMLDSDITASGSRYSLLLQTGTNALESESLWGNCVALKRVARPQTAKKVYQQWWWTHATEFKYDSPRAILFGLDTALMDATRVFWQIRWNHWTWAVGGGSSTNVYEYRVSAEGAWQPILDQNDDPIVVVHPPNENKRNEQHTEVVWDFENNRIDGLRINGLGFGSLSPEVLADPDDARASELHASVFTPLPLPTFESGCNPVFGVYNSNGDTTTHAWANLLRQRTEVVA